MTIKICKLCQDVIKLDYGTWVRVEGPYNNACPTATGEISGHLPEDGDVPTSVLRDLREARLYWVTTDSTVLEGICSADPDGQGWRTSPPTAEDYAAFRADVIETFGQTAWDDYRVGA